MRESRADNRRAILFFATFCGVGIASLSEADCTATLPAPTPGVGLTIACRSATWRRVALHSNRGGV